MKNKTLITALSFFFMTLSQSANAGFMTSTELMQSLENYMRGEASYDTGITSGYIQGVHDLADGILVCAPRGTTVKQLKLVVYNHMNRHPEIWNENADKSIIQALQASWPCEKQ